MPRFDWHKTVGGRKGEMNKEHLWQITPSSFMVDTFDSCYPLSDNQCALFESLIDLLVLGTNSFFFFLSHMFKLVMSRTWGNASQCRNVVIFLSS